MRKLLLAVCLTLLCGCSSLGSADRGDLDMERALAHMAEEMREADVGVLMNAECEDTHVLQQLYDLQLQKGEYALIRGIRADVSQEYNKRESGSARRRAQRQRHTCADRGKGGLSVHCDRRGCGMDAQLSERFVEYESDKRNLPAV